MKRLRIILTLFAVPSLLLLIASTVLWVRSYWVKETIRWGSATQEKGVMCSGGQLMIWRMTIIDATQSTTFTPRAGFHRRTSAPTEMDRYWFGGERNEWNRAGFGFFERTLGNSYLESWFLPCWVVVAATALLPSIWLFLLVLRRRRASETEAAKEAE